MPTGLTEYVGTFGALLAVVTVLALLALTVTFPWLAWSFVRNVRRIRIALERIADANAGAPSDARPGRLGL